MKTRCRHRAFQCASNEGRSGHRCMASKGSALVAVFWIMAVLSLAVFAAVRVVYHDADASVSQIHGFDAMLAAERGVSVAVNPVIKRTDPL